MATFEVVPFTNFTDANFTFAYNKENYLVKAGETKYFPPFIVVHGAKHLVDRELIREGKIAQLNDANERERLLAKILGTLAPLPQVAAEQLQEMGENKPTEVVVEEEFPDLKKLNQAGFPEVDLSRGELFAKVRELGFKIRATATNGELKRIIAEAEKQNAEGAESK